MILLELAMIEQKTINEGYMEQEDMTAPEFILEQLGGNRFENMIGATNIIEGKNLLSFKVMQNPKEVSHLHIVLNELDLFDVEFLNVNNAGVETLTKINSVYPDNLQRVFNYGTGLDIHL
jgi:hypothetical protein